MRHNRVKTPEQHNGGNRKSLVPDKTHLFAAHIHTSCDHDVVFELPSFLIRKIGINREPPYSRERHGQNADILQGEMEMIIHINEPPERCGIIRSDDKANPIPVVRHALLLSPILPRRKENVYYTLRFKFPFRKRNEPFLQRRKAERCHCFPQPLLCKLCQKNLLTSEHHSGKELSPLFRLLLPRFRSKPLPDFCKRKTRMNPCEPHALHGALLRKIQINGCRIRERRLQGHFLAS